MSTVFSLHGVPELHFQRGNFQSLPSHIVTFGRKILVIAGVYLLEHPGFADDLTAFFEEEGLDVTLVSVAGKKTQQAAYDILDIHEVDQFDCVVSIGGSRAIDTGKLVARHTPFIAVPTTAGTGAAMNAVIFGGADSAEETRQKAHLPDVVVADPEFLDDMERADFAARALSVFTLLMEAYVSPKASVLSDALVWSGLEAFARGFVDGVEGEASGRDDVFYASLIAGIGAADAGFGLNHRLAALIEQKTNLSYAQASATIAAEVSDAQVQMLSENLPDDQAMDKYAMIGELIAARPFEDREEAYASLVGTLRRWVARLEIPKIDLGDDLLEDICDTVVTRWEDDVLPVRLSSEDLMDVLLRRSART